MPNDGTFLNIEAGRRKRQRAIGTSAGTVDASKIVMTGSNGRLDASLLPANTNTTVVDSTLNGNIVVNGAEIVVFDPTNFAATNIVQTATHRFVSDTEKGVWDNKANNTLASATVNGLMTSAHFSKLEALPAQSTIILPPGGPNIDASGGLIVEGLELVDLPNRQARIRFHPLVEQAWDFLNGVTGTPFSARTSGTTGSAVGSPAPVTTDSIGEVKLETGTADPTTSNVYAAMTTAQGPFTGGQGILRIQFRVYLHTLSASTDEFVLRIGFVNGWTSGSPNGCFFEYNRAVSPNWRLINTIAGTQQVVTSNAAVVAGSWQVFEPVIAANAASTTYLYNGESIGLVSGGVPAATNQTMGLGVTLNKVSGLNSRAVSVDYARFRQGVVNRFI